MSELVIQYHDFENAKNEIKRFSEQTTMDLDLKRVDDSKGVSEFWGDLLLGRGIGLDHVVKGEELNNLTSQIQTQLHRINNTQIKLSKEFGQVYNALEALDKDYIQAILVSIKATEETSEGIQRTQEQIKKIVENQRRTLEELKKFKKKLDSYIHLEKIDKMWESLSTTHESIKNINGDIKGIQKVASKHYEEINNLLVLKKQLSLLTHLIDIDIIWTSTEEQKLHLKEIDRIDEVQTSRINALEKENMRITGRISENEEDIKHMKEGINKFNSMAHLEDVDSMWNNVSEHSEQLIEIEKKNNDIVHSIQENKENVEEKILSTIQTTNGTIESLTKKIKYAYWIAGGAAGLAIIELILILLRVI